MAFKAAKCPECGADIQVPSDRDSIKCMYCGKDIVVRQALGANVSNWLTLAGAAAEAGNHDEAYDYFTKVLEVAPKNHEAWFGKAVAAGWGANLTRNRYPQLIAGIERAIDCAPSDFKNDLRTRGAEAASEITTAYFALSVKHTAEYIALDDTWDEHLERCFPMLAVLKIASDLDPKSKEVVESGIALAKSLLEGVVYNDPYETDGSSMKTKHLPNELEVKAQEALAEFVEKMTALDATYKAPTIQKAGEVTAGGCLIALVLLGGLGYGAWWIFKAIFLK